MRRDGVLKWQWHQLDIMQTISISLQTSTPHHSIFTGRMLFLTPNQQCHSTIGKGIKTTITDCCFMSAQSHHADIKHSVIQLLVEIKHDL